MHTYLMTFGDPPHTTRGTQALAATADHDAVSEVRQYITVQRTGSWATITLQDGRTYICGLVDGKAVGRYC